MDIISFKPIHKNILVLPDEISEMKSSGGIILTETYDTVKTPIMGTVVAVSDKLSDIIKIGDKVMYQKMYELSITVEDKRHVILRDEHIMGIIGKD